MYDFYTTVAYPIFNSLFSSRLASISPPRGNREHIIPGKPRIMQKVRGWFLCKLFVLISLPFNRNKTKV